MYYVMRASAPSLHRESTDSLILILYHVCMHYTGLLTDNTDALYLIPLLTGPVLNGRTGICVS